MKSYDLILSLRDFLRTELAVLPLPDPITGFDVSPHVFIHNLPDRLSESGDLPASYPFVIIRLAEGETDDNQCRCIDTVMLVVGVWAPESQEQAGLLATQTLDAIRISLRAARIIGERFELEELNVAQPEPQKQWNEYHLATVNTRWNYTIPRRAMENEDRGREPLFEKRVVPPPAPHLS